MSFKKHLPLVAFCVITTLSVKVLALSSSSSSRPALVQRQAGVATVHASSTVKSYREWKTEKISVAQLRVSSLKAQLDARKQARSIAQGTDPNLARTGRTGVEAVPTRDISVEKIERQLREEQYDLEVAKDLSVTDYFVGYLTKIQDKKSAFKEVAGKLSPEEVAELMTAYANSVFGAHSSDLPASANNTTPEPVR
ncbi:MAG: hypothetical protein ACM3MG_01850 [Bacillota bacterium]